MGMVGAVKSVLSNYVNFSGRAARPEYWWWALAVFIIMFIAGILDAVVIAPMLGLNAVDDASVSPLSVIILLAIFLPNLAVAVRRLHDTDRSGWWILLFLVPIIGFFLLLFWYVSKGTEGDNRFGPPPVS
ncbi:DUF805 domain-containing protein [Sneathiella marina]|uniref:DUF805 domain-containing protein n=1 Tax=Sneathiella marina TaxID=2950108 RepID=UPI003B848227